MLVRRYKKISRNKPCPCGSGLKFKKCSCYKEIQDIKYVEIPRKNN